MNMDIDFKYRPLTKWQKIIKNILFPDTLIPVEGADLNKIGIQSTVDVPEEERPKEIKFPGITASKNWFNNTSNGIGHFNENLYKTIQDYQKFKQY